MVKTKSYVADSTPVARLQPTINSLIATAEKEGFSDNVKVDSFPIEFGAKVQGAGETAVYARFYDVIVTASIREVFSTGGGYSSSTPVASGGAGRIPEDGAGAA
jgi:hypothetical protein